MFLPRFLFHKMRLRAIANGGIPPQTPYIYIITSLSMPRADVLGLFCEFFKMARRPRAAKRLPRPAGGATIGVQTSAAGRLSDSLCSVGTNPGRREEAGAAFSRARRVYDRCHDIRRIGAASVELCYTACGRLDAYMEHGLKPWDYAAGGLILTEAGGRLTAWDGTPPSLYAASCAILATNGRIHEELLALV